ncbi:hypothetical protein FIBSPDRAFT_948485 [Athelia psychrophila]|uniref:Uncharacterized protein n=1 Tax=Athelia psychrophila TaxID=1759441 RepID=A0A166QUN4_9AGAM|nr:hypothetical protein FIBSPDRAFT_948485 [Fibularhizoctonia sp. CBS 109695]
MPHLQASTPSNIPFPFDRLSAELALEVIRYASTPTFSPRTRSESQASKKAPKNPYSTALALCLVSRAVRHATLPQLLHTVILTAPAQVYAFTRFLRSHRHQAFHFPLTKRMWLGGCPSVPGDTGADYDALAMALIGVEELGVDADSLHLLYGPLQVASAAGGMMNLKARVRRVTFAGEVWRWKPLTSTPEGGAFLADIERLSLCFTVPGPHAAPCAAAAAAAAAGVSTPMGRKGEGPEWMREVPLEMMPRLRVLEFVSTIARGMSYVTIDRQGGRFSASGF